MAVGEAVIRDRVISVGISNATEVIQRQPTVLVIAGVECG